MRDNDASGLLPHGADPRDLVAALDAKNQRWVDGAAGLSRRVVSDLLVWAGRELADHDAAADLTAPAFVGWAADGPVPAWLDLAREFTEQWVHQQQIREAVRLPGSHRRHLDRVLRTFVWAYPHQLGRFPDLPADAVIALDLGDRRRWDLVRRPDGWDLEDRPPVRDTAVPDIELPDAAVPDAAVPDAAVPDAAVPDAAVPDAARPEAVRPDAAVAMDGDVAWRVLTGAPFDPDAVIADGDPALVDAVLAVRGVLI